jgi:hypothetical protein
MTHEEIKQLVRDEVKAEIAKFNKPIGILSTDSEVNFTPLSVEKDRYNLEVPTMTQEEYIKGYKDFYNNVKRSKESVFWSMSLLKRLEKDIKKKVNEKYGVDIELEPTTQSLWSRFIPKLSFVTILCVICLTSCTKKKDHYRCVTTTYFGTPKSTTAYYDFTPEELTLFLADMNRPDMPHVRTVCNKD